CGQNSANQEVYMKRTALLVLGAAAAVTAAIGTPAGAVSNPTPRPAAAAHAAKVTVIATHLRAPRGVLLVPGGIGLVSESGNGDGWVVTAAGGNDILRVSPHGKISLIAVLHAKMVLAPPFLGLPPGTKIPMQAVPTSVVCGPDGALYVGQLTGFPFPVGAAN